jgi:hypothetical protein
LNVKANREIISTIKWFRDETVFAASRRCVDHLEAALRATRSANEILTCKSLLLKKNLVDQARLWSNTFRLETDLRSTTSQRSRSAPMTHRILAVAILAAAASQLSLPSIASAQETNSGVTHRRPTMSQNIGPNGYFPNQAAARAAHPITQGGTTGGTVNPGLTRDHMQHGYNG